MNWIEQLKAAKTAGVPIVCINTPDPAATIRQAITALASNGDSERPIVEWDVITGVVARGKGDTESEASTNAVGAMCDNGFDGTKGNPVEALVAAKKLPPKSLLFVHLAHKWLAESPHYLQAVWNLRDEFKKNRRILVLLGKGLVPPPELVDDVVLIEEPLPDADEIAATVKGVFAAVSSSPKFKGACTDEIVGQSVEALRGVSTFAAEQATAMAMTLSGLNVDELWEHKRKLVESTPGLTVWRGNDSFDKIGGLRQVKSYLTDLLSGPSRPSAVIWLDELEKALGGSSTDTSGVSQDQLGNLLTYMEDHNAVGVLLVGAPGTGKSAIAKAAGSVIGAPTVRLDLGGMKGSLVGQSEQTIRNALKVVTSISNDRPLFIATANSIAGIDSALKRRFPFIFYVDVPDAEEKAAIWKVWTARYELKDQPRPNDDGWSGANIQKCCECAWRLNRTLVEAAKFIIPVSRSAATELETLRRQATGTFLSASKEGAYQPPKEQAGARTFEPRE